MEYRDVMVSVAQLEIVVKMVYKVSDIHIILLRKYEKLVVHSCDMTTKFTVLRHLLQIIKHLESRLLACLCKI